MSWPASIARQPPAGEPLFGAVRRGLADAGGDPARRLWQGIQALLGPGHLRPRASGRAALVAALREAARHTGRRVAILPAYTCYTVAAAACVAGLRVRLVDVDADGRIDAVAFASLPLDDVAAVVVCNLFGHAEPIEALAAAGRARGIVVIDDAAQALGAGDASGPAGARGDLGVLSFARGKPLAALGGGALFVPEGRAAFAAIEVEPPPAGHEGRSRGLAKALAHDVARSRLVFRVLSRVPALGIGETRFETDFPCGPIDETSLSLAAALVGEVAASGRARAERARRLGEAIEAQSSFRWIRPAEGASTAAPRLALRAPDATARDVARAALVHLGATGLYPRSLDTLPELRAEASSETEGAASSAAECPGARRLASGLLTLPTHGGLSAGEEDEIVRVLARIAPC